MQRYVAMGLGLALSLLASCVASDARLSGGSSPSDRYRAQIRWTQYGIPHIKSVNWKGLGFGFGYAVASNAVCVLAEEYATVKGERSKYFGATDRNINSDAFYIALLNDEKIAQYLAATSKRSRDMDDGYAHGYNHYLNTHRDALPARCRNQPWVKPIDARDLVRVTMGFNIRSGFGRVASAIANAAPNTPQSVALVEPESQAIGSNAIAIGKDLSATGRGLLLGNPHYPWQGGSRFHLAHLTIPGELDVMGAGTLITARITIAFTNQVAWTHTVSTALRSTMFRLDLVQGNSFAYKFGNQVRSMQAIPVAVETGDGTIRKTIYMTHLGPVLSTRDAPWTDKYVYVMRDSNYDNYRASDMYKDMARAQSVEQLRDALAKYQSVAFVNTIAADKRGTALFADLSAVPNVSAALIERCSTGQERVDGVRMIVLNGSIPDCDWQVDKSAAIPGLMPPSRQPVLFTTTHVSNSNNSHWLTNPQQRLEGFSPIVGDERTQRALRTRAGLNFIDEVVRSGEKFTAQKLQEILFSHRNYAAEVFLDDLLAVCDREADVRRLTRACNILRAWDRRQDIESVGAQVFDEFWLSARDIGKHYAVPFDVNDPTHTPRGFSIKKPETRDYLMTHLASAVATLDKAGVPLDAKWGDVQFELRNNEKIGLPGGSGEVGMYSVIGARLNPETHGYNPAIGGNSYIQVVTWNDDGTPAVKAIVAYSQSQEPDSPHYSDMTKLYSKSQWLDLPFTDRQIDAALVKVEDLRL